MKRGCLLVVGVLAGAFAAWAVLLFTRAPGVDSVEVLVLSGLAALMTAGTFLALRRAFGLGADEAAIRRALRGEPLEDGRRGAALGELRPCEPDEALAAPFSGKPALAYEYEVHRQEEWFSEERGTGGATRQVRQQRRAVALAGHARLPCEVRTVHGGVRVVTRPVLDLAATDVDGEEARERARRFVEETTFETVAPERLVAELKESLGDFTSADAPRRRDTRREEAVADLAGWTLSEKVVSPGQQVCVVGDYSVAAGGLAGRSASWAPVHLRIGEPGSSVEEVRGSRGCLLVAAGVLVLLQLLLLVRVLTAGGG